MNSGLIDIGANLAHDSFDTDREAVLQRAWDAGLDAIVITGSSRNSALAAAELAKKNPRLFSTAGLHPHHADEWSQELRSLFAELAQQQHVVCLGECGLDYFRDFSPRPLQRQAFVAQIQLAIEVGKPLFLHQRDAHEDFAAILREHRAALGAVVVHCFTDSAAAAEAYLEMDCHIGITGWICDERRGKHLLDIVPNIPANRLMIETDAPYLLPRTAPKQASRRNEPALLPYVLATIAKARNETEASVAQNTRDNACAFFGLDGALTERNGESIR